MALRASCARMQNVGVLTVLRAIRTAALWLNPIYVFTLSSPAMSTSQDTVVILQIDI